MNNLIRRVFQDDGQNSQLYIFIEYNNNDENFWFRGNDVAMILEYKRLNKAISKHVEPEDKKEWKNMNTQNITNLPANWQPRTLFIHEIGLYSLISGSKMDRAKRFKRWIFKEVLISLMKTRHYTNPSPYQYNLVTEKIVQKANMIIDQENSKLSIMSENKQKYQMFRLLQHKYDPTLYHQICGQPTNINNVTRKKSQEYIVIFTRENIISGKSFSTGFLEYLQRNQLLDSSYYNAITTSEDILKIVNKYIEEHLNKNRITNHLSIEDKPLEIKAF